MELVLDNSDGRLPDGPEVILRRQIGAKKDEYFVNMKKTQKVCRNRKICLFCKVVFSVVVRMYCTHLKKLCCL